MYRYIHRYIPRRELRLIIPESDVPSTTTITTTTNASKNGIDRIDTDAAQSCARESRSLMDERRRYGRTASERGQVYVQSDGEWCEGKREERKESQPGAIAAKINRNDGEGKGVHSVAVMSEPKECEAAATQQGRKRGKEGLSLLITDDKNKHQTNQQATGPERAERVALYTRRGCPVTCLKHKTQPHGSK